MPLTGNYGLTGHRAYFRVTSSGTVPFGATALAGGYFARSENFLYDTTKAAAQSDNNNGNILQSSIGCDTPSFQYTIVGGAAGQTAANDNGWNPVGGQGIGGKVTLGSGNTAIAISALPLTGTYSYGDSIPAFNTGAWIAIRGGDTASASQPVAYYRVNGLATYNAGDGNGMWTIPVVWATGTWTDYSVSPLVVNIELPAQFKWDGTPGSNKAWAGPDEVNDLFIAHPVPATGGAAIQTPGSQTQPVPAGVTGVAPDSPNGGVGFWGINRFDYLLDTYVGNELVKFERAFYTLVNQVSGASFASGASAQAWVDSSGYWTNYRGPGKNPLNP